MSICESVFAINDNMPMDSVNSQVLQCIIYRFEQTYVNILTQRSTFHKGLMKYNKKN
jgi:hypothetical protein